MNKNKAYYVHCEEYYAAYCAHAVEIMHNSIMYSMWCMMWGRIARAHRQQYKAMTFHQRHVMGAK